MTIHITALDYFKEPGFKAFGILHDVILDSRKVVKDE